MVLIWADTI